MVIDTKFDIGDFVTIDDDKSIHARVTGVSWRAREQIIYEVCWFSNGNNKSEKIEEWRLSRREA